MPDTPSRLFARGERADAYRTLVRILKADPGLKNVRTWVDRSDLPADRAEVGAASCPYVRLTPTAAKPQVLSTRGGRRLYKAPIEVEVETAVGGGHADDPANLWDAIRAALFRPGDNAGRIAIDARLRAVGVMDVRATDPAIPAPSDIAGTVTAAGGTITLDLYYRE